MAFDFSKLQSSGALAAIREPSTLFDALPNKADGYGYLRVVQKAVLDVWSKRRDEQDLVIKTNTGGGKTIVGLLMLQCCLHEGKGPALYISPEAHLSERVQLEADHLGLQVVDSPDSTKFLSGEAICATTLRTLINSRSRFGIAGGIGREPVRVGSIVVDDAHAALALTQENTRLSIASEHPAHGALLDLFDEELRAQGLNAFKSIVDGDRGAVLRVPFWAWRNKHEAVLDTLRPHRNDKPFEWTWPLLSDLIPLCQAVVTADTFEIEPPCPPIEKFPSFAEAERRIYLTATLADDSVLVTDFDADPQSVARSVVPDSAGDLGDRLILAPQELNPDISHDELRGLTSGIAQHHNAVVLVPSWHQAGLWSDSAARTASTNEEISAATAALTRGHVGLVVIVNRYDGIDLPDDACRLLVIDNLPSAHSATERRATNALRDSDAFVARQIQRLEQGMGRGVRSRDDYCVVLLAGPRLTQLVARADIADRFSAATRAQLGLSRRVAANLEGQGVGALAQVVEQVIGVDPDFRTLSREALLNVKYDPASVAAYAQHLRLAYNCAVAGQETEAANHAKKAVAAADDSGDPALAGWIGEMYAAYLQPVDAVKAQTALARATRQNRGVLRPIEGSTYEAIELTSPQSKAAAEFLKDEYSSGQDLVIGVDAVMADIAWDNERTDDAEAALERLGRHLGFATQMPERDYGRGSDVLWALGNQEYAVIEAKTGATAPLIWKRDVNQLAGSVNWCEAEYGSAAEVVPVLVHPSRTVEGTGSPPSGTRVITEKGLRKLANSVAQYARALGQNDTYRDAAAIESQLMHHKLTAEVVIEVHSEPTRREPPKPPG